MSSVLPSRIRKQGATTMTDQEGETTGTPTTRTTADPRPAAIAMMVGNVIGAVGLILGFVRLSAGGAEAIKPVALLAVGILGVVSFVRHSILHASDVARMKWDLGGRTDNFQIEVGMANLAWGLVAIAAVLLDWGTYAQAALTLVFGLYLLFAASIHLRIFFSGPSAERRSVAQVLPITIMSLLTLFFAFVGLAAA
jgi:hypothetical protein